MKNLSKLRSVLCTSVFFNYPEAQKLLKSRLPAHFEITFLNLFTENISKDISSDHVLKCCDIIIADPSQTPQLACHFGDRLQWIHSTTAGVEILMDNADFKVSLKLYKVYWTR